MANPNAVVSTIIRIDPPLDRAPVEMLRAAAGISVELEGGLKARLDPANTRSPGFATLLDALGKQRLPVYLEIEPSTSVITRLLIPQIARVASLSPIDTGVLGVDLYPSHARHVVRRDRPDFDVLERDLREALRSGEPLIVTEDDGHGIIDIRPFKPGPDGPLPPPPFPSLPKPLPWPWRWFSEWLRRIWQIWCWPWRCFRCTSMARATQVFNAMSATSCAPLTVSAPCIPFLYPDDGCWARAHEMCRLIRNQGLTPKKVWIQGRLYVSTKNNPLCGVWWGWHVAPTLCVRGPQLFQTQEMVIDPSLFNSPVTKATWKSLQGDPNASLTATDGSIYWLWSGDTDPGYLKTNDRLAYYRLRLQSRAIQVGPPPYTNCP